MNQYNPYQSPAAHARPGLVEARAQFITRTYAHLFGAIAAFTALEVFLFKTGIAYAILPLFANWWLVLGAFVIASMVASRFALGASSKAAQYFGLGVYIVAEALIFIPLLTFAEMKGPGVISSAAFVTMAGFGGLTAVAFVTRKDFSFLRGFVMWGGIVALLLIGAALLFGLKLGVFFSVAMVALAGASILYDTSNVLRHFPTDRYVGAALRLFSSVALMFYYILSIFMSSRD
ncbi:MAG: US12 family protein [Polyangiaceae bacterium]|nr:US12 family protein [Myxococcales bacterium]MCB9585641.1 US12 family protein [Polyangiaceae bacterium]